MSTNSNFSSDKPIENENDDRFQRYGFSKRVAETIIQRKSTDCIVIGVYGAWGEGKTSVINFIEKELEGQETILSFKFNPWRFTDENALLLHFFQQLASALNTNIKTRTEKIGDLIGKYSDLVNYDAPWIGNIGKALKFGSSLIKKPTLEESKKRVEEALIKANIKIVVFIDDIDRLDKDELHAIFRLVKLNADFSNIVYVLAFDEKMVASAISQRFGNGEVEAGESFLEKIIQVPLKIPVAQPTALKNFTLKLVEEILNSKEVEVSDNELSRFVNEFTNNILVALDTPRLAVRYSNSISFSLPLLNGEINVVDLLIIEALKIFYPTFYHFIKDNPKYFIDTYSEKDKQNEGKKEAVKEAFERLTANFSPTGKQAIKNLLIELFPLLKEAFLNYSMSGFYIEWYQQKKICSPFYFNRYFTYSVIKGEISDIEFDKFLANVEVAEHETLIHQMRSFCQSTTAETFLRKLRMWDNDLPHKKSIIIAEALVKISDEFKGGASFGLFTVERNLCGYLKGVAQKFDDSEKKMQFVLGLIEESQSYSFAYELFFWLKPNGSDTDALFTEQFILVGKKLLARGLSEAGDTPLFEKFPDSVHKVFAFWKSEDIEAFNKYLIDVFNKTPSSIYNLVEVLAPHFLTSNNTVGQANDIDKEHYQYLLNIIDMDMLIEYVKNYLKANKIMIKEPQWNSHRAIPTASIENLMFQLLHYHSLATQAIKD
jgi:predicted KAP-like P-loop ATPase